MQTSISTSMLTAYPGQLFNYGDAVVESYTNNTPQMINVVVTADTSPASFVINGSGTFTANPNSAAQTIAQNVASAAALVNAGSEPVTVDTALITSTTITIYADVPGTAFTCVASTGCTTSTVFTNNSSIPFGRLVVQGPISDDGVCLPYHSSLITGVLTVGVTIRDNVFDDTADLGYTAKATMSVLRKGKVWVTTEAATTPHTVVYVRHTINSTYTARGTFSSSADSATCSLLRGAVWKTTATAQGTALLEINFPAV